MVVVIAKLWTVSATGRAQRTKAPASAKSVALLEPVSAKETRRKTRAAAGKSQIQWRVTPLWYWRRWPVVRCEVSRLGKVDCDIISILC
ncbi:hypothetical protein GCM10007359_12490 [Rothia aerolata]|uniref:Uncharacterized protein n=1 Tax=Rothia aerolata TaxID=1812262 RepID=A0A917ITI9_9MICC|nr:hypothetical protein GCM10007359_12490 [Rothia aerolata]